MPLTHDRGVRIPYPRRRTIATAVVFFCAGTIRGVGREYPRRTRTNGASEDGTTGSTFRRTRHSKRGAARLHPPRRAAGASGCSSSSGDSIPPASERSCEKERKRHLAVDIGGQAQRSAATGPFLTVSCCRQAKAAKTKNSSEKSDELLSVPRTRLELARTKRSLPPQSSVSTNFTTWALPPNFGFRVCKYRV